MRSGRNPTRRNRNIGTAKQGHGQDNRLVIPAAWCDYRIYWEKLKNPVAVALLLEHQEITLVVEPVKPGYFHACTPEDIAIILNLIDPDDLALISTVVLRQPTEKQQILSAVWGRMAYWADLGPYEGPTVYLEAQTLEPLKWSKSLSVDSTRELERLEVDGHRIERDRRHNMIHCTPDSIRATQLYRTLPHEIGHAVDYERSVWGAREQGSELSLDELRSLYHSKPSKDKEDFAHRYADEFQQLQQERGTLPFPQNPDPDKLRGQGLEPDWFTVSA